MEPRKISPEKSTENKLSQPEHGHDRALSHLTELSVGTRVEREQNAQPSSSDTSTAAQAATAATSGLPIPAPVPVDNSSTDDTSVPLVAADEDLIEKEWVDKVKKVIAETKDDPYLREQQVKQLQVEYVRKRYGRGIGDNGD